MVRHRRLPLAEVRLGSLNHSPQLAMSQRTGRAIASSLLVITDSLRLGDRPDALIPPAEIETQATRWAARPSLPSRSKQNRGGRNYFITYATHWLQFLGRWQAP